MGDLPRRWHHRRHGRQQVAAPERCRRRAAARSSPRELCLSLRTVVRGPRRAPNQLRPRRGPPLAARGCGSETSNDPHRCDFARLEAFTIDDLGPEQLVGLVDVAGASGRWVIMAGHDGGQGDGQTVLAHALEALCHRVAEPDVWVAPVAEVARYLQRVDLSRRVTGLKPAVMLTATFRDRIRRESEVDPGLDMGVRFLRYLEDGTAPATHGVFLRHANLHA